MIASETDPDIYPAQGKLPNSGNSQEWSTYFGHSSDAIVAIGVTTGNETTKHILGIAAGASYATLNATQCSVTFTRRAFEISACLSDHSVTVTGTANGNDFPASKNLTRTLIRHYFVVGKRQVLGRIQNRSVSEVTVC